MLLSRLEENISKIRLSLEEQEMENVFMLKMIKKGGLFALFGFLCFSANNSPNRC
ncbi:MAG: hypothetical protein KAR87_06090 [Candidatus Aenigmarchaeota archaeon]|nr:hypothetical protein [Candidatus Aenigmarchaeota archaeon]